MFEKYTPKKLSDVAFITFGPSAGVVSSKLSAMLGIHDGNRDTTKLAIYIDAASKTGVIRAEPVGYTVGKARTFGSRGISKHHGIKRGRYYVSREAVDLSGVGPVREELVFRFRKDR